VFPSGRLLAEPGFFDNVHPDPWSRHDRMEARGYGRAAI
jgi:hypothetical protein